jgi:hypothetical protein
VGRLLAGACLLASSVPGVARAQFSDASVPPLDSSAGADGVAWADYDGDGDLDLFVSNKTANELFRNDGTQFVDVTTGALADSLVHGRGAVWADHDNDGDLDLYIANKGPNRLFRNDAGTLTDVTAPPLDDGGSGRAVACADYDGDGDVDIYVANDDAPNVLFRNDDGTFVDAAITLLADAGRGVCAAWGDYDDDGDPDLYLSNGQPDANRLFRNDGGGAFVDVTVPPLGDAGNGRGVDWGDYDNDGDLDLYLVKDSGTNRLYRNDGAGGFADVTAGPLGQPGKGDGCGWADYDNDGDLDIYLANWTIPNTLLRNDGASFANVTVPPLDDGGPGRGMVWGDYDGDGDVDLYLANSGLANKLFRNDTAAAGNHWLHVDLVGTVSNRSAIGARVRLVAPGGAQVREVSAGSGLDSQNSLTVEFGLGQDTSVDSVVVRWPSGLVDVRTGPGVDQRITIVETVPTDAKHPGVEPLSVRLHAPRPNPARRGATLVYELPRAGWVQLRVYDVAGRRVRSLAAGARAAGRHRATWDGRDGAGRRVAAGIYLLQLEADGQTRTRPLVVVR